MDADKYQELAGRTALSKLKKELGDVLWYLSDLCKQFGFSLSDVMETNIEKFKKPYPDGFSCERSINREE